MTFSYHRALAPMLWTMVAIGTAETLVLHLLLVLWWPALALAMGAISLAATLRIVRLTLSLRRLPVVLDERSLLMRVGTLRSVTVARAAIAGPRAEWDAAALREPEVARLSLLAYPNVLIDLRVPARDRSGRAVRAIAHRLDDPVAFVAALARLE